MWQLCIISLRKNWSIRHTAFFTWEFVVSSNLKEYEVFCISVISSSLTKGARPNWRTYLDFASFWEYFAANCESENIFWTCHCHHSLKRTSDFYLPYLEPAKFLHSKFGFPLLVLNIMFKNQSWFQTCAVISSVTHF